MTDVVRPFDPWKSKLCTCGEKYSFNPYTGCMHGCLYCYATYIPRFGSVRLKERLLARLEKDLRRIDIEKPISMSNSSDPYPPIEKEHRITRNCIKLMKEYDVKLLVVTKSDIVARDVDILSEMNSCVSVTVTGFKFAKILEPNAPEPEKRIEAMKRLKDAGIPVVLRLDPVLPFVNEEEVEEVLRKCDFVDHVVTSTLKLRGDSFKRIVSAFPRFEKIYKELYFKRGEKIQNSWYMPESMRLEIIGRVEKICDEMGISCAFCREGFLFKAESCDGQHLL
ncbi:SPL family radical SAM protein [Archaeoglobus veneficus]|uniref:Radical SAM domain protein n=1 Tax=Archaeoglobus veneficus (strain DSM 11195 / SNP6) TaxID=693661 RepID=F2KRF5_ARCVS|nr:radical SAM protein [Archaeoglobus veneficus]AEA47889.1 Radical SAM domain protein [Archaeoglobus veneficus SNP6]